MDVKVQKREYVAGGRLKLDSNTPAFSGKSGERLDEWLFVLNTAFESLKVTNDKDRLAMATVYVKDAPLKSLMAYRKEDVGANWTGFQKILRSQFEPRHLEMRIRTQLWHLRQGDSLQRYLKKFNELTVQLSELSERDKLVAFTDGLNEKYKYEVISKECKTVAQAVDVACNVDFCEKRGVPEEVNTVKKINFAKFRANKFGDRFQKPYKKSFNPNNGRQNKKGPYNNESARALMECYRCKLKGHLARDCRVKLPDKKEGENRSKPSNNNKQYNGPRPYVPKKSNILAICKSEGNTESLKCVTGTVNNVKLKLALDSGATCCIISARVARLNNFKILASDTKVKVATNEIENVVGITEPMVIDVQGHSCILELYVINHEDHDVLLGLNWFMATGAQFCPSEGFLRFKSELVYLESEEKYFADESTEEVLLSELSTGADSDDIEGETDWPVSAVHSIETVEKLDKDQAREFDELKKDILGNVANSCLDLGENNTFEYKIRKKSVAMDPAKIEAVKN